MSQGYKKLQKPIVLDLQSSMLSQSANVPGIAPPLILLKATLLKFVMVVFLKVSFLFTFLVFMVLILLFYMIFDLDWLSTIKNAFHLFSSILFYALKK